MESVPLLDAIAGKSIHLDVPNGETKLSLSDVSNLANAQEKRNRKLARNRFLHPAKSE